MGTDCASLPSISLVIPAYNEEADLKTVVEKILSFFEETGYARGEIIIVDDGSYDRTGEIADELALRYERVRAVHHEVNEGLGIALRTGWAHAAKEYISTLDADDQFDIRDVFDLFAQIGDADVVMSKFRERIDSNRPLYNAVRAVLTLLARFTTWLLLGCYIEGGQIPVVRTQLLQGLDFVSETGAVNSELFVKVKRAGGSIKYGYVTARPRVHGESKVSNFRTVWLSLVDMWRIRKSLNR